MTLATFAGAAARVASLAAPFLLKSIPDSPAERTREGHRYGRVFRDRMDLCGKYWASVHERYNWNRARGFLMRCWRWDCRGCHLIKRYHWLKRLLPLPWACVLYSADLSGMSRLQTRLSRRGIDWAKIVDNGANWVFVVAGLGVEVSAIKKHAEATGYELRDYADDGEALLPEVAEAYLTMALSREAEPRRGLRKITVSRGLRHLEHESGEPREALDSYKDLNESLGPLGTEGTAARPSIESAAAAKPSAPKTVAPETVAITMDVAQYHQWLKAKQDQGYEVRARRGNEELELVWQGPGTPPNSWGIPNVRYQGI